MASHSLKMASNRLNVSHMTHFASGGHIKAPSKKQQFFKTYWICSTKTKSELSLRFCPARDHSTKMQLIIINPGVPSFLLACHLYLRSLASFTSAPLPPSSLLACCLCFYSTAAFTSAPLLPLILLACFALIFCGFAKWLVVDCESLYLHFDIFSNTTWRHTYQFWFFLALSDCIYVQWESIFRPRREGGGCTYVRNVPM